MLFQEKTFAKFLELKKRKLFQPLKLWWFLAVGVCILYIFTPYLNRYRLEKKDCILLLRKLICSHIPEEAQAFSQIEFLSIANSVWSNNNNIGEKKLSRKKNLKARSWENRIKIYAFPSPSAPPKSKHIQKTWPLMSRVKIDKRVLVWIFFSSPKYTYTHTLTLTFINLVYPFTVRAPYRHPLFLLSLLPSTSYLFNFNFQSGAKEKKQKCS